MSKIEMPGHNPVVDFDYFRFDENNRKIAQDIAIAFLSYIRQDDLQWTSEFDSANDWAVSVGSGGTGMHMSCMTQGHQRAIIASAFASYTDFTYSSLYLGLPEYHAIRSLAEDIEDNSWGYKQYTQKNKMLQYQIKILKDTMREFEREYMRHDPGFLFNLIKND